MKSLPIILILIFSCSVAWGEEDKLQCVIPSCKKPIIELLGGFFTIVYCEKHRIEDEFTQKRYYSLVVEDFQKEIELLKDRITELERYDFQRGSICKIDGKLKKYNYCADEKDDYIDWGSDNWEYLGKGRIYSVDGRRQYGEAIEHFWYDKDKGTW